MLNKRLRYGGIGSSQAGGAAVEFAILALGFFMFVFLILEAARVMFVFNSLQEATRRASAAAVNINFQDRDALRKVQQAAVFRDDPGELVLAPPVTDQYVRIDYLALTRNGDASMQLVRVPEGSWPSGPAANRHICLANPNAPNCIRFVRVRICDPSDTGACNKARLRPIFPFFGLTIPLTTSTAIAMAESLGYQPGMSP